MNRFKQIVVRLEVSCLAFFFFLFAPMGFAQDFAKTNIKPDSKPPAIIVLSVEDSKALKDLNRDAENADLRQQLLTERIRAAQVELEKLQQASKDAIERFRVAMRGSMIKSGIPPDKIEDYDLSEEKGQFVLKLKSAKQ